MTELAKAHPTKAFFVTMLTKDISLSDAILDLVDNSLDGALRCSTGIPAYAEFAVDIELSESRFAIKDNCGGIPRDVALNYAFKMGRDPSDPRNTVHETIGMYGIGMKRAMFKLGRSSLVRTRHGSESYDVKFTPAWLDSAEWTDIPLQPTPEDQKLGSAGTFIEVTDVSAGIRQKLGSAAFVDELKKDLGDHFAVFIEKGFVIRVNGTKITPTLVRILADPSGPRPYYFRCTVGDTLVQLAVGLNPGSSWADSQDEEREESHFADNRALTTAGWTVFCNDRAVLVGDKTRLTGWGDSLPLFHPQFSVITGVVEFRAKNATGLPVTTTKRALDTTAEGWLIARTVMRLGLGVFVRYTNAWKNISRTEQQHYYEHAAPCTLAEIAVLLEPHLGKSKHAEGGLMFDPEKQSPLPKPEGKVASNRRIIFSRPKEMVERLGAALLDDAKTRPGLVGEACFDRVHEEVTKK